MGRVIAWQCHKSGQLFGEVNDYHRYLCRKRARKSFALRKLLRQREADRCVEEMWRLKSFRAFTGLYADGAVTRAYQKASLLGMSGSSIWDGVTCAATHTVHPLGDYKTGAESRTYRKVIRAIEAGSSLRLAIIVRRICSSKLASLPVPVAGVTVLGMK